MPVAPDGTPLQASKQQALKSQRSERERETERESERVREGEESTASNAACAAGTGSNNVMTLTCSHPFTGPVARPAAAASYLI